MPSIRYMNQSAPFWDFIASMEEQGSNHPFFAGQNNNNNNNNNNDNNRETSDEEGPWAGAWGGWGWPHRGWHRGPPFGAPHSPHPPHPPHPHHGPAPPPPPPGHEAEPSGDRKGPEGPGGPEPPAYDGPSHDRRRDRHEHRRGRCGGRRGFGGRGRWGAQAGPFNMGGLSDFIQSQMWGQSEGEERAEDFKPEADVFDTEAAFIVHASLPGAKKEDIAVSWDAEKSELSITGVTYRPGDEDFLKTLALDERKIGAFERKVRLGSRAHPAQVNADDITAKLEEGILFITVPKQDKDYVEVKKVDIE